MQFTNPPFIYYNDMWAERKASADCSRERIFSLLAMRRIKKIDRRILYTLDKYGFLNGYLLRICMEREGLKNANPKQIKERLLFLLKNGLIFRYEFFHFEENASTPKGSSFVYSLSGGGRLFLKITYHMHLMSPVAREFYNFGDLTDQTQIAHVLSILSENQFAIIFEEQYHTRIGIHFNMNEKCFLECMQRMEYYITCGENSYMRLYPVAIRQQEGWQSLFRERLLAIKAYAKSIGADVFSILVICESSEHALLCEDARLSDESLQKLDVFYGLDYSFSRDADIFENLLEVHENQEGVLTRNFFNLTF